MNKVRVNAIYKYNAAPLDLLRPCTGNNLKQGQVVRVINLPMAPKANTMGQCYVAEPVTRKFLCMITTASLEPLTIDERGCYSRLSKRRTRQCVAGAAIVVTSGPRPNEAYAEVVRP